jgi:hypothetical protein
MRRLVTCLAAGVLGFNVAYAETLTVDKKSIRFTGPSCQSLAVDAVSFSGHRLTIDLSAMKIADSEKAKISCLIMIPYTEGKGKSTWTLSGNYLLGEKDYVAISVRPDPYGGVEWGSILNISESPKGKFAMQDTLIFDPSKGNAATLRISLTGNLRAYTTDTPSRSPSQAKLGFTQLSLSDVKEEPGTGE